MSSPGSPAAALKRHVQSLCRHPEFRRGLRDMAPMVPGLAAWGLVTGVAMVRSGLYLWLALLMSLTV